MSESAASFRARGRATHAQVKPAHLHDLIVKWSLRLVVALVIIAVWEAAIIFKVSTPFWISQPRLLALRLAQYAVSPKFGFDVLVTLYETAIGFALGCVSGGIVGFLLARHRLLDQAFEPYLTALYSLPRIALAPLFILWFGIGIASKVALAVSIVFFILMFNVYSGVRSVDRQLLDAVRTMGASRGYLTRKIILPSCTPWIFSGMRIALGMALTGTVVGEMIASQNGIGRLIAAASGSFDTTGVFAALAVLAIIAMILNASMGVIERRIQRWQGEVER